MSSILTNTSAMVALQTLKSINSGLAKTQSDISTGKSISSAKDNSAVWAISKVMESDVAGFNAVSDALSTGKAMVGVARTATESITDILKQIKTKVVAAQDSSADTEKLQAETDQLVGQVNSILSAAQFNGVNLVNKDAADITVLGSIDRSTSGVAASRITVAAQAMDTTNAGTAAADLADGSGGTAFAVSADTFTASTILASGGDASITLGATTAAAAGDVVSLKINDFTFSYQVTAADVAGGDANDVALANLNSQIQQSIIDQTAENAAATAGGYTARSVGVSGLTLAYDPSTTAGQFDFTATADNIVIEMGVRHSSHSTGLTGLGDGGSGSSFDITSGSALSDIEDMITFGIDASAAFGASQARLEAQASFVSNLTDALKTGIGVLVDADMEAASAKLQALQVQQQLATQSLSIANQAPQNLLSLFR
ncbi:flagellin [Cereibacter sphaeroides]|uniref:flagellin N-terminal helical domain-containing protein n=1 Tax=Cereibacter sphaeroides TaxID=1063 RepID=UPI001F47A6CF|nr:flagellin [Cereibacter sphaeroides]MCE6957923.1 flagellin [Cereibacter sphaeroides]MCE6972326.1 flagellin [Cereibacter sphaeroides]